jgi:FkbM family methyltransferase
MNLVQRWLIRLRDIAGYASLAASPADSVNLAVLGLARGHPFDANDWLSRLGRYLYPTIRVRPAVLGGLRLELNSRDVSQMVIFDEVIRDGLYDLKLVPFDPTVILDCGAHIGMFTLKAARTFPAARLSAFEPHPRNVEILRAHKKLNSLAVEIVPAAVSLQDGDGWLRTEGSFGGTLAAELPAGAAGCRVRVVDLRTWLRKPDMHRLLLKIDVEGEERTLIPGILPDLPRQCALFFESHDGAEGWTRLCNALTETGFQVRQLTCHMPFCNGFASRC